MSTEKESSSILSRVSSSASIAQSVLTAIAIIATGVWFLMQGEAEPKANIEHTVIHREINDERTWIRVSIKISNQGKRLLNLESGLFSIHQVLPLESDDIPSLTNHKVSWPLIGKPCNRTLNIRIEPGEEDCFEHEFIIPHKIQAVEIYSYFQNPENPGYGWQESTVYDLTE
jgi:hypothetical protein